MRNKQLKERCECHCHQSSELFKTEYTTEPKHMKNKYCPEPEYLHEINCIYCRALNRQREDMEKEILSILVPKPPIHLQEGELYYWWNKGVDDTLRQVKKSLKGRGKENKDA